MVNVIPSGDIPNQPIHIQGGGNTRSVSTSNISDFYRLAKDWATFTDGLVENLDYSAKQYAINASNYATAAENSKNAILSDAGFIAVSQDLETIDLVGENIGIIQAVANNFTVLENINDSLDAINALSDDIDNIDAIASDLENIDAIASDLTNIDAVSANETNINAVATDIESIRAVADDLENIDNAQEYANAASQSATNAATSETNAGLSANAASQSEDNAEIWAEGTDEEVQALGGVHSAKGWAAESASGQINSNFTESDPTSKAFILNKPTETIRKWY